MCQALCWFQTKLYIYLKTNLIVELAHLEDAFFLLYYAFYLLCEILLLEELVFTINIKTHTHTQINALIRSVLW